ncbi:MAG: hypothetical protein IPO77_22620 [Acidobacteria bacterium]|nr:hypothetical protein [Acidobacteriota bacterium]
MNVGPISLQAQTTPEKLKDAIKAINIQIELFDSPDYFTDEELESAKTLLDVEEIYGREKPSEYAHTVSFWWASSGLDYFASYVDNLRKVTRADIKRYVDKYIHNKPRVVAVLISEKDQQGSGITESDLLKRYEAPGVKVEPKPGAKSSPAAAKKPVKGKPAAKKSARKP